MGKVLNDLDFVGGAKITGLPVPSVNGQPLVYEQLASLTGGVTQSALAGGVNAPVDVASAATCDIGAATSQRVNITGTTTITSLGTSASRIRFVTFAGALTLTHNATTLNLPTGANITTAAGDRAIFMSNAAGEWTCLMYLRANGKALAADVTLGANTFTGAQVINGQVTIAGALYNTGASAVHYFEDQSVAGKFGALYRAGGNVFLYSSDPANILWQFAADRSGQWVYDSGGTARQIVHAGNVGTYAAPPTSGTAILKGNGSGGFAAAAAGTDYLSSGVITSGNLGYGSGTGGTVTQATSGSTAVTLNKMSGKITTVSLTLTDSRVSFTFNNSLIGADDVLLVQGLCGPTCTVAVRGNSAGSRIIQIDAAGSFSGAVTISFVVLKVATT